MSFEELTLSEVEGIQCYLRIMKKLQEENHGDEVTRLWHTKVIAEIELSLRENRRPRVDWTELGMPKVTIRSHYKRRRYEILEVTIPSRSDRLFAFLNYETVDDLDPEIDPSFLVEKSRKYNLLMNQLAELRRRNWLKKKDT